MAQQIASAAGQSMCILVTPQPDGTVTATYHGPFSPLEIEVLRLLVGQSISSSLVTANDIAAHQAVPKEGIVL